MRIGRLRRLILICYLVLPLTCPSCADTKDMGQPATLVIDIETVGRDPDLIPSRAREILLDARAEEDRLKLLDTLGLDPCTGRIICIGVQWIELDRSRAYCQSGDRELLASFRASIGPI